MSGSDVDGALNMSSITMSSVTQHFKDHWKMWLLVIVGIIIIIYLMSSSSSSFLDPGVTLTAPASSYRYVTGVGWNTDGTPGVNSMSPSGDVTSSAVQSAVSVAQTAATQAAVAAHTAASAAHAAASAAQPVIGTAPAATTAATSAQQNFAMRMGRRSNFNADNHSLQKILLNQ
jgi:hypothetical protein